MFFMFLFVTSLFALFYDIVTVSFFYFLHDKSLLVPYAYASIELIHRILLSWLALNSNLLVSSVKTQCLSVQILQL